MPRSIRLAMACVALGLLFRGPLVAAASVDGSFERTYSVTGAVDLAVENHSGDISIRGGPPGTVTIRGKIHVGEHWFRGDHRADVDSIEKDPPIRQSGNSIRIDYLSDHDISVDYEITAPPDTSLRMNDGSGNQEVEGLRGTIDLETGSGDVRLRDIVSSRVSLHDGSGEIVAQEISGPLTAEAGSGNVRLEEKGEGDVRIRTGSGDIDVRGVRGALRVESGSGDAEISGTNTGTWEVRTGSGNVDLTLPAEAAFDLDATTNSGNIVTERAISMTVQGDLRKSQHTVRGKVAGGGPLLKVHSGSGDIRIH
jgi:Putative adhesin